MIMNNEDDKISWLYTPPLNALIPPVETKVQFLPFEQIRWEDFEKLCYRIIRLESNVDHCQQYGVRGGAQHGIDIFARVNNSEKYRVFQCKNEKDFGPAKIASAVRAFVDGKWLNQSDAFILCTRESLKATNRAEAVEEQAKILKEHGVSLLPWDRDELCSKLKTYPEIVDDFFGRPWVKAFCGEDAANRLSERLDADALKNLRTKLFSLYDRVFNIHDKGIPFSNALSLIDRYIIPDTEADQTISFSPSTQPSEQSLTSNQESNNNLDARIGAPTSNFLTKRYSQRLPIQNWVVRQKKSLLFGDPGSGKSTFLRFLALDILKEDPTLACVAEKWGAYIPVWIPFALWTKIINQGQTGDSSVRGVLDCWLKSWDAKEIIPLVENALKDKRLLLLIDGLDEHSNNDSAKIALNHLESFLGGNDLSVIATTRPHGFEKLGMNVADWQQAKIADFSVEQQRQLTHLWFKVGSKKINPDLDHVTRLADIQRQTETFFAELARSNELRELAHNPLLLCLLISFQIAKIRLPLGRFNVYDALINHLISVHPQSRRVASDTTLQTELPDEDVKKTLAYLANNIQTNHPEGLIREEEALKVMVEFLVDDEQGFGLPRPSALKMGNNILSKAEDNLGILVKKSQEEISFFHRTIQEYLASFNISRLSLDDRLKIISNYCVNPLWREVILGLFQITKSPNDIRSFIKAIQERTSTLAEKKIMDDLLSEVVFGNFNCPPHIARDLAKDFFKQIELGTWMSHREKLLRHVLDGLRSTVMSEMVREKIQEWFPDRFGWWNTVQIFESMAGWNSADDLLETLFKGLNAGEYRVKVAAALALSKVAKHDLEIGNRLVDLANNSDDPYVVAAATEGLISGWPDHPMLKKLVNRHSKSPMPILTFVGIRGRIALDIHTKEDLKNLFKLADRRSGLYQFYDEIAAAFITGWPKSEEIKKECFRSLASPWSDKKINIAGEIVLKVFLEGYPLDEDIAAYFVNHLERNPYPFSSLSYDRYAFITLAKNFKDHPKLVDALDQWVQKQEDRSNFQDAHLALVGRTSFFKKRLFEHLNTSSPYWVGGALLEGWGMEDAEVSTTLRSIVNGPADKASQFADLLPKIITDKAECRKRLIEILKDPNCIRVDFVMRGLVALENCKNDTEVVDVALPILDIKKKSLIDGFAADLIKNYPFDSRVRQLALETIESRDTPIGAIASAFGNDAEIRSKILKIATPLPTPLRQIIARYLSEAEIEDSFAISILKFYDHDKDKEVKVQSSIGYHTRLKNTGGDSEEHLKILAETLVCGGDDYGERNFAAFCGLTILGRLDIMYHAERRFGANGEKARVPTMQGGDINISGIQFILKNWQLLKEYFKEEFLWRFFDNSTKPYMWNKLAGFVVEYPIPRQEVLNFLALNNPKIGTVESLSFLSKVQPGSHLVLDYCLTTLGFTDSGLMEPSDANQQITYHDQITAAEIIGEQFGGNNDVLKRMNIEKNKDQIDKLILILWEGWSESKELDSLFKELVSTRRQCNEYTLIRCCSFKANLIRMYLEIIRLIRTWSSSPRYHSHRAIVNPLVKRVQKDNKLVEVLTRQLKITEKPSEKVSISKLLYKAKGFTPELKTWAEKELALQLSGNGIEAGFDITTGEFSSMPHTIYEILKTD